VAVCTRLAPFGSTIFSKMTALANEHRAINLSQGFPDFDGPQRVQQAAMAAMRQGHNQYAPHPGVPALTEAIAAQFERRAGISVDDRKEITVTAGCTEAIAATCLGLLNEHDEVVVFEPYYDSYRPCCALAGAATRSVTLHAPDFRWREEELRAAFGPNTRAVMLNTPHNPTGRVFDRAELEAIAKLCVEHDALCFSDEVYDRLVFEGEHISIASLPGMRERTVTMGSIGKTYSLTGWKIGWAIAPRDLTAGVRAAHQFMLYAVATPLQHGAAAALRSDDAYYHEFVEMYRRKRDLLCGALESIGFGVTRPQGTYFVLADHTPFGFEDDVAFCTHLVEQVGVAAIPPSAFYDHPERGQALVRFAFCKEEATLEQAVERMGKLREGGRR